MPTPERFWDRNAAKYAKSKIGDMPAYEVTLERIRTYLEPQHKMLEFACGTGSTALLLAPEIAQIIGTDISGEMQTIATEKAAAAGVTNVEFRKAGAYDLQPEGPFDVVFGSSILHLLEGWPDNLKKLREHVKPGGLFITKTPCLKHANILKDLCITIKDSLDLLDLVLFWEISGGF